MLEDDCSHFAGLFAHSTWPHDLALLLLAYMDLMDIVEAKVTYVGLIAGYLTTISIYTKFGDSVFDDDGFS